MHTAIVRGCRLITLPVFVRPASSSFPTDTTERRPSGIEVVRPVLHQALEYFGAAPVTSLVLNRGSVEASLVSKRFRLQLAQIARYYKSSHQVLRQVCTQGATPRCLQ
jgi:hypothetical protein